MKRPQKPSAAEGAFVLGVIYAGALAGAYLVLSRLVYYTIGEGKGAVVEKIESASGGVARLFKPFIDLVDNDLRIVRDILGGIFCFLIFGLILMQIAKGIFWAMSAAFKWLRNRKNRKDD